MKKKPIKKIQYRPISQVQLNPNNPRTMDKNDFQNLKKSIEAFPQMLQVRPLGVADGIVIGGNMRLLAMKDLGYKEVPCIDISDFTPEQLQEFLIKDNLSYGKWDWDALANEWDTELLNDWGFEIMALEEMFDEGTIDERMELSEKEEVVITLTMPYYEFQKAEKEINNLTKNYPNMTCRIQN